MVTGLKTNIKGKNSFKGIKPPLLGTMSNDLIILKVRVGCSHMTKLECRSKAE